MKVHGKIGFIALTIYLTFASASSAQKEDHLVFSRLLNAHVVHGRVDYPQLCKDARLSSYITQLKKTSAKSLSGRKSEMAFWLNAYNAYTLLVVCENYPIESITELHFWGSRILGYLFNKTVWHRKNVIIGGKIMSLDEIEHKIIRPRFADARVHFALVCAAKSCPALRSEAYEAKKLEAQLNDQARTFLADNRKNRFDVGRKHAALSAIFSWFSGDFGKSDADLLRYLAKYAPKQAKEPLAHSADQWNVDFIDYDWDLND